MRFESLCIGVATSLLLSACGGEDSGRVVGSGETLFIMDSGEEAVPWPLQDYSIAALVEGDDGEFAEYPGTGSADGTFVIDDVPKGDYYLELTEPDWIPSFRVTSERDVELQTHAVGRPDAEESAWDTDFLISADGLVPWSSADSLFLYSSEVGGLAYRAAGTAEQPAEEATSITDLAFTFWPSSRFPDGDKGDRIYLSQLATTSSGAGEYQALARSVLMPAFSAGNGATTSGPATSLSTPERAHSFALSWSRAEYATLAGQIHPGATPSYGYNFAVVATPKPTSLEAFDNTADLVHLATEPGDGDLAADISYRDPFPAEWRRIAHATVFYDVPITAPEATIPLDIAARIYTGIAIDSDTSTLAIAPLQGPVQAPLIDGVDAFATNTGLGSSPELSWSAPTLGLPTSYYVAIERLYDVSGTTVTEYVAELRTTATRVRIPPGVLVAGESYIALIVALQESATVKADAGAVTGIFTP